MDRSRSLVNDNRSSAVGRPAQAEPSRRPSISLSVRRQYQCPVAFVDLHRRPVLNLALQPQVGERVLQIFLHRALQGPGAVDRVVAEDRKSGVWGKSVPVRVDPGGPRILKKKTTTPCPH